MRETGKDVAFLPYDQGPSQRTARPKVGTFAPTLEAVQGIKRPLPEDLCAPYNNKNVQLSGQGRGVPKQGPEQSQMAGPVKRSRQSERASLIWLSFCAAANSDNKIRALDLQAFVIV